MTKSERGTKRTDPETGKKFYDLNKDPVVSPYTGKSYPLSFFEQAVYAKPVERTRHVEDEAETEDDEVEAAGAPEIVSLEDADAEEAGDDIPDVEDVEVDTDLGDDDDDAFLEEEDEADDFDIDVPDRDDR